MPPYLVRDTLLARIAELEAELAAATELHSTAGAWHHLDDGDVEKLWETILRRHALPDRSVAVISAMDGAGMLLEIQALRAEVERLSEALRTVMATYDRWVDEHDGERAEELVEAIGWAARDALGVPK